MALLEIRGLNTYYGESHILRDVDISVDYGGSGIPAFYKDGEPFHTKLDLSFQELSLLTSKDVGDTTEGGY